MQAWLRKFGLAVHVIASVGWMGAVAAFAAVALAVPANADAEALVGTGNALAIIGWAVIVPAAAASILSGVVQSLGTGWGLTRHYWVLIKLGVTGLATLLLLLHMKATADFAAAARSGAIPAGQLVALRHQLAFDAGAGLAVLLAVAMLSFFKPRGLTPWGWRASFSA